MQKWIERFHNNRLFVKILLYFLSLLIPILIIGIVTYINFTSKLKHDFNEKITLNLAASSNTLDKYLRTVQEVSFNFFNDSIVTTLLKPDHLYTTGERSELERIIRSIIRTRSNINDFVDDIFVYIDDSVIYSSTGVDSFDSFFNKVYRFHEYDTNFWKTKLQQSSSIEILNSSDVETLFKRKKVIPFLTAKMIGGYNAVIVSTVSVDMIKNTVMDNVTDQTRVMVVDNSGHMIVASDPQFPEAEALAKMNEVFKDETKKVGEITIQGKAYMASLVRSEMYGWVLFAITPVSEFNKQASGIINMLWIISVTLIVISFVFSFIFTFRIYNPIRRIGEILVHQDETSREADNESVQLSDLNQIGSRLLRNQQRHQNEIHTMAMEYLDNTLLHLTRGNEIANEKELQKMLSSHLGYSKNSFLCCTVLFDFREEFYSAFQDVDRFVIQNKIKKLIWGLLQDYAKLYVLEYRQNLYICILNVDDNQELTGIEMGLDNFMQTFRNDSVYSRIHVGIGKVYEGLRGITRSYRDAMTALQSRNTNENFQTIRSVDLDIQHNVQYSFSAENKLLNYIKVGDSNGLKQMIEEVLRANANVSYHDHNGLISEMYHTGLRLLMERELERNQFLSEQEHRQLFDPTELLVNLEERKRLLLKFFCEITDTIAYQQQNYKSSTLVSMIISYVDGNYAKDLYLERISEEMNVSTKYISRLFKDKVGMNITDYISHVRISKAKEMMANTELSINDIAERVGITNRTTFLRTFKKIEGLPPNEFRKSIVADCTCKERKSE